MDGSDRDDRVQSEVIPVIEDEEPALGRREIEPGDPRVENVLFVLLGVVLTIVVFLRGLGIV